MKRRLFSNERELHSWHSLTLTSHRVIYLDTRQGFVCSTSIPLAHVQWTRIARSHKPVLLLLAGLVGTLCMWFLKSNDTEMAIVLFIVGAALAISYLGSRRAELKISSGGGHIELPVDSSEKSRKQARDFVDAVESAALSTTMAGAPAPGHIAE